MNNTIQEFIRPWKLVTFALSFGWLMYGAYNFNFPGWTPGVSTILGVLAYFTAPFAITTIYQGMKSGKAVGVVKSTAAIVFCFAASIGVYYGYNTLMHNSMILPDGLIVSFIAFIATGIFWSWRGSVAEFFTVLKKNIA